MTRRRRRLRRISIEPIRDYIMIKLLAPQQPGIRLPRDEPSLRRCRQVNAAGIEVIGFGDALGENAIEVRIEWRAILPIRQAKFQNLLLAWREI